MAGSSPAKEAGRQLPLPYLSPPEEPVYSNFSTEASPSPAQSTWQAAKLPPINTPHSPPASPNAAAPITLAPINSDLSQTSAAQDPPLFSHTQSDDNAAPLFNDKRRESTPRSDSLDPEDKPWTNKLSFHRRLESYPGPHKALQYWQDAMDELRRIPGFGTKRAALQPPVVNTRLDAYTAGLKHKLNHPSKGGVTKPRPATLKPTRVSKPTKVALPSTPPPRKAPRTAAVHRESKSASVEPQARKRAAPTKQTPPKAEDKDWAQLDDFSPPTSTLDKPDAKPLKVTWKGSPNDLTNDPEAKHMHPQEVETAAELKLFGAQYLANKRRIFIAKVDCLKQGKNFTKTAAQQACNIDVNKTSKLWEAYDKSGWFNREHFEKFL